MKVLLSRSAISKIYAAIIAIIVIVAIIAGALYYVSIPGPSPSPSASSSASPSPSSSPAANRVLRYMHPTPWYIDPAVGSDLASSSSLVNLYDPLVYPQTIGEGGGVNPWVATNWTVSSDGLTWTFTIRQGITFHSGRELNATDVAFSMNRLLAIGEGYAYIFSPYINSTVATDPWTVVFTLGRPFAPFLSALIRFWIVDSTTVIAHETTGPYGANGDYGLAWMDTHDAGSGPYEVKENSPEAFLDMVYFPNYWGSVAPLHPTELYVIAEPTSTTEQTMMTADEAEISSPWLPEQTLDALSQVKGIYIANIPEGDEYYYMINTRVAPLDDVHVRMALAYCLNYTGMVATLYPRYVVSTSCVPSDSPGYVDCSPYTYNVTMAKYELSLSKYANNISDYPIQFDWISAVPIREQDALFFASCAAAIGVTVNVVSEEWAKFIQDVSSQSTTPGMANVLVNTDYNEAGSLLEARYSSKSEGTWEQMEWLNDSTFDSMLESALGELNTTQRFADYANLQKYVMNICPSMFIYDYSQLTAVQSYVSWPMASSPMDAFPCMGYNYDCRLIQIEPH